MVFIIPANNNDIDYCSFNLDMGHSQEKVTGLIYFERLFSLAQSYSKVQLNQALKLYHEYKKFESIFTVIIIESNQNISVWLEDNRLTKIRSLELIEIEAFFENLVVSQENYTSKTTSLKYRGIPVQKAHYKAKHLRVRNKSSNSSQKSVNINKVDKRQLVQIKLKSLTVL